MPAMNNITVTPEYLRKVADLKRQQLAIDEQMKLSFGYQSHEAAQAAL